MSRIILAGVTTLLLATAATRSAFADHEAWVLRDSGVQCAFHAPLDNWRDNYYEGLYNQASFSRWMSCPVSLSARWASSQPAYPAGLWGRASTAAVYVNNSQAGTAFSCRVQAQVQSGALYWSRTVSTTAAGDQRLMPNSASNWGGTFEAVKGDELRALEFSCQVPPGSGVHGYKVRMCIRNSGCIARDLGESLGNNTTGQSTLTDTVQISGIACMSNNDNNLVRSELGARNVGANYVSIICPIPPPADDTLEVTRRLVREMYVKYKGKTGLPGEVPPTCQLHAIMRNPNNWTGALTDVAVSSAFVQDPSGFEDVKLTNFNVGEFNGGARTDVGLTVHCDTPPGYTIQGIHSNIMVAPVSGGF